MMKADTDVTRHSECCYASAMTADYQKFLGAASSGLAEWNVELHSILAQPAAPAPPAGAGKQCCMCHWTPSSSQNSLHLLCQGS